jgi:hypothetical protein
MNKTLKPLSMKPPIRKSLEEERERFILEAENPSKSGTFATSHKPSKVSFPWEEPMIRSDLKKSFQLRLSEKDFVKLEYLANLRKTSKHQLIIEILLPAINNALNV